MVTRQDALDRWCNRFAGSPWLAVDTEFLRVDTYYPRLCLIQIACDSDVICIDPLAKVDLEPVMLLLRAPETVKVMHSARQDLEVLYLMMKDVPQPVFDTQVAGALLGYGDQVGYATLVNDILGISLQKSETRTDWCARPLTDEQIEYAEDDVRYLGRLYQHLHRQLIERGREPWAQQEFTSLTDTSLYVTEPADAYKRLRRGHNLSASAQHVLKALAQWRESTAQREDRPRNWIADNKTLMSLAQRQPRDLSGLNAMAELDSRFVRRRGDTLLATIDSALAETHQPPVWNKPARFDAAQRKLCDSLMSTLSRVAEEQQVAQALLGTRRDIKQMVSGDADTPLLRGWRGELIGDRLWQAVVAARSTARPAGPKN